MRRLHADDGAAERARQSGVVRDQRQFDFFAARLVEDLAERRVGTEIDGEAAQRFLDRLLAVVAERQDFAPVVFDDQGS